MEKKSLWGPKNLSLTLTVLSGNLYWANAGAIPSKWTADMFMRFELNTTKKIILKLKNVNQLYYIELQKHVITGKKCHEITFIAHIFIKELNVMPRLLLWVI